MNLHDELKVKQRIVGGLVNGISVSTHDWYDNYKPSKFRLFLVKFLLGPGFYDDLTWYRRVVNPNYTPSAKELSVILKYLNEINAMLMRNGIH